MKKLTVLLLFAALVVLLSECRQSASSVQDQVTIYSARSEYCAWPSIIRAANGDLLVTFCRSEEHLAPDGQIVLMRSSDNGLTWQGPHVIFDTILDDRECGMTVLRDGRILVHLYTYQFTRDYYEKLPKNAYEPQVLDRWLEHVEKEDYRTAVDMAGAWMIESRDNGHTWSNPRRGLDTIHGGIQLNDGRILLASYRNQFQSVEVYRLDSVDDAPEFLALISPPADRADSLRFGEPHILQMPSGRVVMMMRATAIPYHDQDEKCRMWGTYSDDHGQTWAQPFQTPLWGFPPHLLLLQDGRALCSYGYRRPPYGQRACISNDGVNWDLADEVILRDDTINSDLGYPASIELEPGKVLTVYYQPDLRDRDQRMSPPDPNRHKPDIVATIWRVPAPGKRRAEQL
ncbi:MAG TPA: sialidase family protein [bacterium]|nr:sialidase family protein [bacterium]HNT66097.1 sialidase family protein [bacterium]HOX87306.1 sialidase family protein [bacterium]HPG46767.1 sialidase family protein [bacterium]HPM98903.1 sialidase family protein [bacterium]